MAANFDAGNSLPALIVFLQKTNGLSADADRDCVGVQRGGKILCNSVQRFAGGPLFGRIL